MVVINNSYKDLHISCLLPYTHPHASSPDFFFHSLLAFFFPGSDQLTNPFAGEFIYILRLLFDEIYPLGRFSLAAVFQGPPPCAGHVHFGGLTDLLNYLQNDPLTKLWL